MCHAVRTGVGAVDSGGLDDFGADVVEGAVHDDDPPAGAGPEGDDREDEGQVLDGDSLDEGVEAQRAQQRVRPG